MPTYQPIVHEYRGGLLDLVRMGYICVVDEHSKVLGAVGDPQEIIYYRSASKPIQALPVIARGIDHEFGLTEREAALFSGSHHGEWFHMDALESILKKSNLTEDMMVMKPTLPHASGGATARKGYHNCSGKHAALMLLQRALGGNVRDYWREDSAAQAEVRRVIAEVSEYPEGDIRVGIDGCGVPVFAVSLQAIAAAYKNLAHPEAIADPSLAGAAARYIPMINRHPEMIKGTDTLCTRLNMDANIIAKGGANGVYALGLKREKIGIAIKLVDGSTGARPMILAEILRQIGYDDRQTLDMLDEMSQMIIRNDNGDEVGHMRCAFKL